MNDEIDPREYVRIRNEYHHTIRVLAVVTELLLERKGGDVLEIDDSALLDAPDLNAWRDDAKHCIAIQVSREES